MSDSKKLLLFPSRIKFLNFGFGIWIFSAVLTLIFSQVGCHPEKTEDPTIVYPQLISGQASLKYPAEDFEQRIQGKTIIRIFVNKEGKIGETKVLESSGSDILDEAALEMVKSSVYEPGTIDGVISDFWLHLPIQFKLDGDHELSEDMDNWTDMALFYQKQIKSGTEINKSKPYEDLFYHYKSLAQELESIRSHKANKYILMVVQKSIGNPWITYQDKWPLGFLLYEDYIKQYPENKFAIISRNELIKSYLVELEFLETKSISTMPYAAIYSLLSGSLKKLHDQGLF